ncbi:MAG: hypothetical protein IEMM0008_0311 [bacterium]|nr:MAG: hypothetical protein IEMM0008_0311 [bacterium]
MMKSIFLLLQGFLLISLACGSGIDSKGHSIDSKHADYYLNFDEDRLKFKDPVSKSQTRGISYYKVTRQSGRIHESQYFQENKLYRSYRFIYTDKGLGEVKVLNARGEVIIIKNIAPEGYIQKVTELTNGKIHRVDHYVDAQENLELIQVKDLKIPLLLTRRIDFKGKRKVIHYFKYTLYKNKLKQLIYRIEKYEGDRKVEEQKILYDKIAKHRKVRLEEYKANRKVKVSFYDDEEKVEEAHYLNESGKVVKKSYYDKSGQLIKEIRLKKPQSSRPGSSDRL